MRRAIAPRRLVRQRPIRFRLLLVWGVLAFGILGLAVNLFRLQILEAPTLQARALAQQTRYVAPRLPRRPILDSRGDVLAIDQPVYTLYAHPTLFKQPAQAIAPQVAPIIKQQPQAVYQALNSAESGIELAYSVSEDAADRLRALQIDGLELIEREQRLYPQQDLLAQIVGYVNADRQPQAGVEFSQRQALERPMRERGRYLNQRGNGALLPNNVPRTFFQQDNLSLKLTVDSALQRIVRDALRKSMQQFNAKRGAVVVMDVHSGAIRSLISEPSYDPNQYFLHDPEQMRNWPVADTMEPGSTFKPINVAIALESGAVSATDSFNDDGQIMVGPWPIENSDYSYAGARGVQSVTEIVQHSSNVGMVRMMQRLTAQDYYTWLEKIGLGQTSGIDLPFESPSYIKSQDQFLNDPVEAATTAFGQGFTINAMQLVQLHSAIANGGYLVTPHLVDGLYDATGDRYWQPSRPEQQRIFSADTTQAVLSMMEAAVEDGTGTSAQIDGYRIAGKTGTAQKASDQGGYLDNARITSFVSLFPSDSPRYAILVVVDEPQGADAYGSTVAAPVSRVVMEVLAATDGISPTLPLSDSGSEANADAEASETF
ncbi:MAG: penicillin-binding protein 2 [Kaiparowitsia implicata GSE-PSE-MK54-09C]|nr:penicillin-binding protein 2 [Kaiparowitsia implicata GSE-PSE-MK54-09C]